MIRTRALQWNRPAGEFRGYKVKASGGSRVSFSHSSLMATTYLSVISLLCSSDNRSMLLTFVNSCNVSPCPQHSQRYTFQRCYSPKGRFPGIQILIKYTGDMVPKSMLLRESSLRFVTACHWIHRHACPSFLSITDSGGASITSFSFGATHFCVFSFACGCTAEYSLLQRRLWAFLDYYLNSIPILRFPEVIGSTNCSCKRLRRLYICCPLLKG